MVNDLERLPPATEERLSDVEALMALGLKLDRDRNDQVAAIAAAGAEIGNDDLIHLKGLPHLEVIDLDGSGIDDLGLIHLRQLPSVARVYAGKTNITDAGLESLAQIEKLEVLDLTSTQVTGQGAAYLVAAEKLLVLNLSHNRLSEDALIHVSRVRWLETLALAGTGLGGRALAPLMRFRSLRVLNLNGCPVEDDGLQPLFALGSLRLVHARAAGVQDLVSFEQKDVFTLDLSRANVITLYLGWELNKRLLPQFAKLPPGSRIVSHRFGMRGIKPDRVVEFTSREDGSQRTLFLWRTPLKLEAEETSEQTEKAGETATED